jgi:hypothetical protein
MADKSIEDAATEEWDLVVLPGGMPGTFDCTAVIPCSIRRNELICSIIS